MYHEKKQDSMVYYIDNNTMNWDDLFKIWLFELEEFGSGNNISFTGTSNVINGNNLYNATTNAVYTFPKGNPSKLPDIKTGLANGTFNVGSPPIIGTFHYDFAQYYATLSNNNVGIQMIGSYPISAKVISKNNGVAVIQFYIYNTLGWDSATRFVKNGQQTIGVIQDKPIHQGLHLGGNLNNTYTWTEIITFP